MNQAAHPQQTFKPFDRVVYVHPNKVLDSSPKVVEAVPYYSTQIKLRGHAGKLFDGNGFKIISDPGYKVGDTVEVVYPTASLHKGKRYKVTTISQDGRRIQGHVSRLRPLVKLL